MDPLPLDLNATNPLRTASADEPEALFEAARMLPQWEQHNLHWADVIVTEWVADALAAPGNREGWATLHRLLERLQVVQPLDKQSETLRPTVEAHYYRWDGMADLLAACAHRHDSHDPHAVEQRTHMDKLKQALHTHGPGLPVGELPEQLRLSRSRISQLLSLAEAAGLIERVTQGGRRVLNPAGIWTGAAGVATPHGSASSGRGTACLAPLPSLPRAA